MIGGQRLGVEDVERRGGETTASQPVAPSAWVDQVAPAQVHRIDPASSIARAWALIIFRVCAVDGQCRVTTLLSASSPASESTARTAERARRFGAGRRGR